MTPAAPLPLAEILLGLAARTKIEVLRALADRAGALCPCEPTAILAALGARESLGSTGVGAGVALPHATLAGLVAPIAIAARLARPIDWEAIDDVAVDLVVAVLTPATDVGTPLDLIAGFARRLRSPERRDRLRGCDEPNRFRDILLE